MFIIFIKEIAKIYFSVVGVILSLFEILKIFKEFFPNGMLIFYNQYRVWFLIFSFIIIPIIYLLFYLWNVIHIKQKINGTEHSVSLCFGNILKKNGAVIIGINTQLVNVQTQISEYSLHGQLLKKYSKEMQKIFCKQANLENVNLGFYFTGEIKKRTYIFLAMSNLINACNATTDIEDIKVSVSNMFEGLKTNSHFSSETAYCPLLGLGAADMNSTNIDLIKLLMKIYVLNGSEKTGIKNFRICIHWKDLKKFKLNDFYELNNYIKFLCDECTTCYKERG